MEAGELEQLCRQPWRVEALIGLIWISMLLGVDRFSLRIYGVSCLPNAVLGRTPDCSELFMVNSEMYFKFIGDSVHGIWDHIASFAVLHSLESLFFTW